MIIILSHSNSSFAESPFLEEKNIPELEIIEPHYRAPVGQGARESERLVLITWII